MESLIRPERPVQAPLPRGGDLEQNEEEEPLGDSTTAQTSGKGVGQDSHAPATDRLRSRMEGGPQSIGRDSGQLYARDQGGAVGKTG